VLATGARYRNSFNSQRAVNCDNGSELQEAHKYLLEASKVAVIGGGPSGIEIASELCEQFPSKTVYLFHSGSTLASRLPEQAQNTALKHLQQYNNLQIKLKERVIEVDKDGKVATSQNLRYNTSIAYVCSAMSPSSKFIHPDLPRMINEDQTIKVNQHLQVEGYNKVFAVGDVAGTGEECLASNAFRHARIVARNIQLMEQVQPLETYEPQQRHQGIMLGRNNAMIVKGEKISTGSQIANRKQAISLSARILPVFNAFLPLTPL
jgi:NADH dehydrogenase FAD-containing subunit